MTESLESRELLAANAFADVVDVAEGEDAKVVFRIAATTTNGTPISEIKEGDSFQLRGYTQDVRTSNADGVFAAYFDVVYDTDYVSRIGTPTHFTPYLNAKSAILNNAGVLDEIGAIASLSTLGSDEKLLFSIPMRADAAGTAVFTTNVADDTPAHHVLVYNENNAIGANEITFGSYQLEITEPGRIPFYEDFDDNDAEDFVILDGSWTVDSQRYVGEAEDGEWAFATVDLVDAIPEKYKVGVTINVPEAESGMHKNAFGVFQYIDADNFKMFGTYLGQNKWVILEMKNGELEELASASMDLAIDTNYQLELEVDEKLVSLSVNGELQTQVELNDIPNDGKIGLATSNAKAIFDDFSITEVLPSPDAVDDSAFTLVGQAVTVAVLGNDIPVNGTTVRVTSAESGEGTLALVDSDEDGKNDSVQYTPAADYRGVDEFTYTVTDSNEQTDSASVVVTVATDLPLDEDFNDGEAQDFVVSTGVFEIINDQFVSTEKQGFSIATANIGVALPENLEIQATMRGENAGGYWKNGQLIFDYVDDETFKYVALRFGENRVAIGEMVDGSAQDKITPQKSLSYNTDYRVVALIEGQKATLVIDGDVIGSASFGEDLNDGRVGLFSNRAKTRYEDVIVKEHIPSPTAIDDAANILVDGTITIDVLANDIAVNGTTLSVDSASGGEGTLTLVDTDDDQVADSIKYDAKSGFRGVDTFSYTVIDTNDQTATADVRVTIAGQLPIFEDFNDGKADDFSVSSGEWELVNSRYITATREGYSISTANVGQDLPENLFIEATLNSERQSGYWTNGFIVVDYQDEENFKFAGMYFGGNRVSIGQVVNGSSQELVRETMHLNTGQDYKLRALVEDNKLTVTLDDVDIMSRSFDDSLNGGKVGLFANRARTHFDDVTIKEAIPSPTAVDDEVFTSVDQAVTINVLANDIAIDGTTIEVSAASGGDGTITLIDADQDGDAEAIQYTPSNGFRGLDTFTYTVKDSNDQVDIGEVKVTVAAELPIEEDFNDGQAQDFVVRNGNWSIANNRYIANSPSESNIATVTIGQDLPENLEIHSTVRAENVGGYAKNAFTIFNYQDVENYNYAGMWVGGNRFAIGEVVEGRKHDLVTESFDLEHNHDYDMKVLLEDNKATLVVDGETVLNYGFETSQNAGKVGLAAHNAKTQFDDITIKETIPGPEAVNDASQTLVGSTVRLNLIANDVVIDGRTNELKSVSGYTGTVTLIDADQDGKDDSIDYTPSNNFRGADVFEYVVEDSAGQSDTGSVSITVAAAMPISEDFDEGSAQDLAPTLGDWTFGEGKYHLKPAMGNPGVSVVNIGHALPSDFKVVSSMNAKSGGGYWSNAFHIFDYQGPEEFKLAGFLTGGNKWVIGSFDGALQQLTTAAESISAGQDYVLETRIEGKTVTLIVDGEAKLSHTYERTINDGKVGLGSINARVTFDDLLVKELTPGPEATDDSANTLVGQTVRINLLANDVEIDGRTNSVASVSGASGTVTLVDTDDDQINDAIDYTPSNDFRGIDTFEYVVNDTAGQTDTGEVSVTVAAGMPISEDFEDGEAQDFSPRDGEWTIGNGRYHLTPEKGHAAASTINLGEDLPSEFKLEAVLNAVPGGSGYWTNAFQIFDYQGPENFKVAGGLVGSGRWLIGTYDGGLNVLASTNESIQRNHDYETSTIFEGKKVTFKVDGDTKVTYTFDADINNGSVGLGSINGRASFDDVLLKALIPGPEANPDVTQTLVNQSVRIDVLANDVEVNGRTNEIISVSGTDATITLVDTDSDGVDDAIDYTPVTDFSGVDSFQYIVKDDADQQATGTVTVTVAAGIPFVDDFDDGEAQDFTAVSGAWTVENAQYHTTPEKGSNAISVINLGEALPENVEFGATINSLKSGGYWTNSMVVFDYHNENDFKFAGTFVGNKIWTIGEYKNGGFSRLVETRASIAANTDYALTLLLDENNLATLKIGGEQMATYQFGDDITEGKLGLGTFNAKARYDDVYLKEIDDAMGEL